MNQDIEKTVLEFLQKNWPKDFSIEEISVQTGIHRNTVSKYVFGLEKAGKIRFSRIVGRAKMYTVVTK